ncbi:MAG: hypothetical protein IKW81_10595 [Pseudobutyrivibrio sp.]|nr:hypothetical protein [Pseudobutyrivibrio sp.]
MERTTFSEKFMEDLKKQLEQSGEKYLVSTNEVQKMNQSYEAITVKPENGLVGVNLNLSEIYERYEKGYDYASILLDVTEKAKRALHDRPDFDLASLQDYDKMKEKLSMEVVSAERNAELLEKVPHKDLEDMAIVYRFVLDTDVEGRGSILITNQLLENYGITAEQLHQDAMEFAPVMRPAVIKTMTETLLEMLGPEAKDMVPYIPEDPIFVATVPDKVQGAGVIAYQDFMDKAAERVGGDFYILPSSIHEVLLVRDDGNFNIDTLKDMVHEANSTEVAPEDILTDSVYHYDSREKVFELAEKYKERVQERPRESVIDRLEKNKKEMNTFRDAPTRTPVLGGEAL